MYRLSFLSLLPKQYGITTIYRVFTLYQILRNDYSVQENVGRLYANTMPFYRRDLSICDFRIYRTPVSLSLLDRAAQRRMEDTELSGFDCPNHPRRPPHEDALLSPFL
jgi:hypothetical protein